MRSYISSRLLPLLATVGLLGATQAHATAICDITFSIGTGEELSAVELAVDYSAAEGTFVGAQAGVQCSALLSDTAFMARDNCTLGDNYCYSGENRKLYLIMSRSEGIDDGAALATCSFAAPVGRTPSGEAFSVQARSATSKATGNDETPATAQVSNISCSEN